ncbi:hypothetical protein BKA62DRAFT_696522 [Auriculariales sp. MPI-PUGE-AT-0066]|nr:hypothetical protein BKA62DRAFT_696522 [Auriculariales sp. MPI-PUGE-AT-0066]
MSRALTKSHPFLQNERISTPAATASLSLANVLMHPSQDDIRRAGIRIDEEVLDKLNGQVFSLQHTRQQIITAIAQSQAALDAVEHELQGALQQRDSLQVTVRRKRTALVRRPFMELPMDLLHCIFEHLVSAHLADGEWTEAVPLGKRKLNRERVLAAFSLASVCRHWRLAALALPTLWSYIGVGCYTSGGNASAKGVVGAKWARLVAGVHMLLDRSKAAPLDVFLDWNDADDLGGAHYEAILDRLGEHATRWRSFELRCIRVGVPLPWLDIFRAPTPMLEELSILSQQDADMVWKSPYPRYLPVAPRLHSLYLEHCPLISTTGLPNLVVLDIWLTTLPAERAWDILLGCPTLQSLLLGCRPLDLHRGPPQLDDSVPDSPIELPSLQTLEMHGVVEPFFVSYGSRLSLPKLTELCLFGHMVDTLRTFFAQTCASIQSLVVFTGTLDDACATSLRSLTALQSVKFIECALTDGFVRALALDDEPQSPSSPGSISSSAKGPMWPELRRVELEKVELSSEAPAGVGMDAFVRMLRARNLGHMRNITNSLSERSDSRKKAHPIMEFIFDDTSLDKYVAAEIRYIMDITPATRNEL